VPWGAQVIGAVCEVGRVLGPGLDIGDLLGNVDFWEEDLEAFLGFGRGWVGRGYAVGFGGGSGIFAVVIGIG
jgi:hypothetical protein